MEIFEKVLGISNNKEVICYSISNSKGIIIKRLFAIVYQILKV